ncbi:helix-turn-helix domain-containing protein [Rhodococcus jostii]|uniref:helix-turn-helix domain-containing protein n=1 Tax=Rhodococcus jostii TaxID=132919 RepID=UPI00364003EC
MTDSDGAQFFAERLERLFAEIPNPQGNRYTLAEIAHKSTELGYPVSSTYLSHLRTGRVKAPSFRTVEGIAKAFGIDVHYFLDEAVATRTRAELEYFRLRADTRLQATAYRLAGLSDDDLEVVNDLIRSFRKRRGLPPDPPDLTED